jgi:hypothetical protein
MASFSLKRPRIIFYVVTSNFRVSEYQYYEFQAIDRDLTQSDMDALRSISTRAEITSTSFTNHYEWGDLKADPLQLLEKYFDAFVYVANWGSRRFYLRLPKGSLEYKELQARLPNESASVQQTAKYFIIGFENENEEQNEWDDGTGWMGSLVSLRSDLLRDDLRCLYLGWLLCVQNGEVPDKQPEPPVPAGLGRLSASLGSLIEFLAIDEDLVAAAAANSAPLNAGPSREDLDIWIRSLPEDQKNVLLITAISESGDRWKNELLRRFNREKRPSTSQGAPAAGRTAGELLSAAQARAERRTRRAEAERIREAARRKAKEEAERANFLDQLAKREDAVWNDVIAYIQQRQPKGYDQAIRLLIDLRELAIRQGHETEFRTKIENLRATHATKPSFIERLIKADF